MALTSCKKYRLFKADGIGGGDEIYSSLRAAAIEKYILKNNLPVDLDINNYYVECYHFDKVPQCAKFSLWEFKDKTFRKEIKDDRGAYTMRRIAK